MKAAVLGKPIAHSLSPALHRAAYAALGLADSWTYDRFEVDETSLVEFLTEVGALGSGAPGGWAGFSLTMPLKQVVLEVAGRVDRLAAAVGAANTLTWDDSVWLASNTDVTGITAALLEVSALGAATGNQSDFKPNRSHFHGHHATILGAGATAASAVAAVGQLEVGSIQVWARDPRRAEPARQAARRLDMTISIGHWVDQSRIPPDLPVSDLVISTLPAHAADQLAGCIGRHAVDLTGKVLLDVAYADWPSAMATVWQTAGGVVTSGLAMLLHQAAAQVELMTRRAAPLVAMRAALME